MKYILLILATIITGCSNIDVSAEKKAFYYLQGEVLDTGQIIKGLVSEFPKEIDLSNIDLETFEIIANGTASIDIKKYGEENISTGSFSNEERKVVDIKKIDTNKIELIFDTKNGLKGANTLLYIHPLGRNIKLNLEYKITLKKNLHYKNGKKIKNIL